MKLLNLKRYWFKLTKRHYCVCCEGKCLLRRKNVFRPLIMTHQKILSKRQLRKTEPTTKKITGPDTLLYWWQRARCYKDYKEADRVKQKGLKLGLQVVYAGDHYEVHRA